MTPLALALAATIRQVPRGRVSTYGAIAKAAGYPRCSRHVSRVLNQVRGLPWQRILGSGGRISLRGEAAMEQRFLLEERGGQPRRAEFPTSHRDGEPDRWRVRSRSCRARQPSDDLLPSSQPGA